MKSLFFLIAIISVNASVSQDSPKLYSVKLKHLTFTIVSDKDRIQGRVVFTKERSDSSKATLSLFGKITGYSVGSPGYGSNKFSETYQIKKDTTGFYVDYGLLRNLSASGFTKTEVFIVRDNALLFYPKNPVIGQEIPSGMIVKLEFYMEQSGFGDPAKKKRFSPGENGNLEIEREAYNKISERRIIGKESKTIMGTKIETYVIQHSIFSASKINGNYKDAGYMKEWYNMDDGLVAFAIYTRKDKLLATGTLTSVE